MNVKVITPVRHDFALPDPLCGGDDPCICETLSQARVQAVDAVAWYMERAMWRHPDREKWFAEYRAGADATPVPADATMRRDEVMSVIAFVRRSQGLPS